MPETVTRMKTVDAMKGMGIICIVMGHVFPVCLMTQWIYAFHVPFFFLISGLTYRYTENKRSFYSVKFFRLLVPYFIFSLISIVLYQIMAKVIPIESDEGILSNMLEMFYANSNHGRMAWNRPLWFLPCLFVTIVVMDGFESVLSKVAPERSTICRCVFIEAAWGLGLYLNTVVNVYLPWHLESACILVGFSELGCLLRPYVQQAESVSKSPRIAPVIIAVLLGIVFSGMNGWTDIRSHVLGKTPVFFIVTSACFSFALYSFAGAIRNCCWIRYLGIHSIGIMLMHKFPIMFFREIVPGCDALLDAPNSIPGLLCCTAVSAVTIILCLAAERILLFIFPLALGYRRKTVKIIKERMK